MEQKSSCCCIGYIHNPHQCSVFSRCLITQKQRCFAGMFLTRANTISRSGLTSAVVYAKPPRNELYHRPTRFWKTLTCTCAQQTQHAAQRQEPKLQTLAWRQTARKDKVPLLHRFFLNASSSWTSAEAGANISGVITRLWNHIWHKRLLNKTLSKVERCMVVSWHPKPDDMSHSVPFIPPPPPFCDSPWQRCHTVSPVHDAKTETFLSAWGQRVVDLCRGEIWINGFFYYMWPFVHTSGASRSLMLWRSLLLPQRTCCFRSALRCVPSVLGVNEVKSAVSFRVGVSSGSFLPLQIRDGSLF